ncbi:MAG: hypothetical protein JO271_17165 [Verrucomicrobia bacterium]|nr:hypothetical protein [Verrucomicrobiota bacterium]
MSAAIRAGLFLIGTRLKAEGAQEAHRSPGGRVETLSALFRSNRVDPLDKPTGKILLDLIRHSARIDQLERQVKTLRIELYVLLAVMFVLAIALSMILSRMLWHLRL